MTTTVSNSSPDNDDACESNSTSSAITAPERGATKLMLVPHEKGHDLDIERKDEHLNSMFLFVRKYKGMINLLIL
jgi:hypothetical protein